MWLSGYLKLLTMLLSSPIGTEMISSNLSTINTLIKKTPLEIFKMAACWLFRYLRFCFDFIFFFICKVSIRKYQVTLGIKALLRLLKDIFTEKEFLISVVMRSRWWNSTVSEKEEDGIRRKSFWTWKTVRRRGIRQSILMSWQERTKYKGKLTSTIFIS